MWCNRCLEYPCVCTGNRDVIAEYFDRNKPLEVTPELLAAVSDAIRMNQGNIRLCLDSEDVKKAIRNKNLLSGLYAKLYELCPNPQG